MNTPINGIAQWWLSGPKYGWSRDQQKDAWNVRIQDALKPHDLSLDECKTMHDVVRVFRGKFFWTPDPLFQIYDIVKCPVWLLNEGGDDCDGWAMTHAQALNYVLKDQGYVARIRSYEADPFQNSHHYVELTAPDGKIWVVQPQPTKAQWEEHGEHCQTIWGPYKPAEDLPAKVASWYNSKVVWSDLRNDMYEV